MTVDPDPIAERSTTVSRDNLKLKQFQDDHEELEAVAEVGDGVKDLLE